MLWGLAHYFKSLEDETCNVNEKYQVSVTLMKLSSLLLRAAFKSKIGREMCLPAKTSCCRPKHDDLGAIFSFTFLISLLTGKEHHLELYENVSTPSWTCSRQSCPHPRATREVLSGNSDGLDGGRERAEQTNRELLFVLRRLSWWRLDNYEFLLMEWTGGSKMAAVGKFEPRSPCYSVLWVGVVCATAVRAGAAVRLPNFQMDQH